MQKFFATTAKGLEAALASELKTLGLRDVRAARAGVSFTGELEAGLRACLWSRVASRVVMRLDNLPAATADALYESARAFPWEEHLAPEGTLAVDFLGTNDEIRNTQFGAVTIKDAIVDRLRDRNGVRPSVERQQPDLRVNARLRGETVLLGIDLSGDGLHRRGYRLEGAGAPLRETLAAAMLIYADWPARAAAGEPFIDPVCGSGTLVIEAALMAANCASGMDRDYFGFSGWLGRDDALWQSLMADAEARCEAGLDALKSAINGYDINPEAIRQARANARRAGVGSLVHFDEGDLFHWRPDTAEFKGGGLLTANPPYGERLGDSQLRDDLSAKLESLLHGPLRSWGAAVILPQEAGRGSFQLPGGAPQEAFNGAIPCDLWIRNTASAPAQAADAPLSEGATMLANRLKKNLKRLKPWLKREAPECYRVYDADMPEYAVAVDRYGEWVHVQEYQPPKDVDPQAAARRFDEALTAIGAALDAPPERIVVKLRKRQRGETQYTRQDDQGRFLVVEEHGARLRVNLTDYLDTGLFLDHRPLRRIIQQESMGKRFLNLFCYTGAITVHAALGGAYESLSVDMSGNYLDWARRNLDENRCDPKRHRIERADCLYWIPRSRERFDLIVLDPPTFSNSKKMVETLDIQRDHTMLISQTAALLNPGGTLFFSTNRKRFQPQWDADFGVSDGLTITEITAQTLDPDFNRQPPPHRCWRVEKGL
ncbi:bifunctional 23S rRNA (guanine(2069)-N(7))-methyltransferase RlmK/23S rRNA (guanine(2445)-N(2))-methyltransferase RlmL [Magnetofaba australis]|uniref:Ribosomal RNA large subunit methyltransferase K/L n=1 Tax=Magnetofaba australis IT-1 TaxID=1434232 RepID=A0A1Y2K6G1_9PROT|nr:bifunctional 23S rRNA (guanine(2069)-N(7))-methyltransferase RlmK/23S rRNA (guanine(2445)-N(2))-methyltransferase RlmL [Magnetofaba australis]OSM05219.1 putative 23S rRNA m(2)G2445 methyltransferase [Magnetofaba australis IT-1]